MGFPVWCANKLLSLLSCLAWYPTLLSGVEMGKIFCLAVSEHLAAVSGLCPRMGSFAAFLRPSGRTLKVLSTDRRDLPFLQGCPVSAWEERGNKAVKRLHVQYFSEMTQAFKCHFVNGVICMTEHCRCSFLLC